MVTPDPPGRRRRRAGCHSGDPNFPVPPVVTWNIFDEWLEEPVKQQIIGELTQRWENETRGNCVFVSALSRKNIDLLRANILGKVKETYQVRYPYKTEYLY